MLFFDSHRLSKYYNALIYTDLVVPIVPEVPHFYQDFAHAVSVIRFPKESSAMKYFRVLQNILREAFSMNQIEEMYIPAMTYQS